MQTRSKGLSDDNRLENEKFDQNSKDDFSTDEEDGSFKNSIDTCNA